MKIALKNLGKLKSAEFELGDLTVICGENNTGKTYATYALYGFLDNWQDETPSFVMRNRRMLRHYEHPDFPIKKSIDQLLEEGKTQIDIEEYAKHIQVIIENLCESYTNALSSVFASSEKYFEKTSFSISVDEKVIDFRQEFDLDLGTFRNSFFSISKKIDSTLIDVSFIAEKEFQKASAKKYSSYINFVRERIDSVINRVLFDHIVAPIFPKPFIASAERTGVATFRSELNFARNKLLRDMNLIENYDDFRKLYRKGYSDYPLPIDKNVDFVRSLEKVSKNSSFIAKKHPKILEYLLEIVGGKYIVGDNDIVRYVPSGSDVALTMTESSSSVRSLVDIVFYLQHSAQKGDLLMIDEPELNLHPKNQRKMASLLAMLVNAGIKVFITTHSDYIIHELNTLILLNSQDSRLKKIVKDKEYEKSALLSHEKVKLYTAKQDDKIKGAKNCTLEPVPIDAKKGVETFNEVISDMNKTQQEILYGGG